MPSQPVVSQPAAVLKPNYATLFISVSQKEDITKKKDIKMLALVYLQT